MPPRTIRRVLVLVLVVSVLAAVVLLPSTVGGPTDPGVAPISVREVSDDRGAADDDGQDVVHDQVEAQISATRWRRRT